MMAHGAEPLPRVAPSLSLLLRAPGVLLCVEVVQRSRRAHLFAPTRDGFVVLEIEGGRASPRPSSSKAS
jgi:hypothetical protein